MNKEALEALDKLAYDYDILSKEEAEAYHAKIKEALTSSKITPDDVKAVFSGHEFRTAPPDKPLMNCPFCKSADVAYYSDERGPAYFAFVSCNACEVQTGNFEAFSQGDAIQKAVEHWNTRAHPAPMEGEVAEALTRLKGAFDSYEEHLAYSLYDKDWEIIRAATSTPQASTDGDK